MVQIRTLSIPIKRRDSCGGKLVKCKFNKKAVAYGFHKPRKYNIWSKRCTSRTCGLVYGPNLVWSKGKTKNKRNMVGIADMKGKYRLGDRPLFVNNFVGFDPDFLNYHIKLLFRAGTGWRSAAFASHHVFPFDINEDWWRTRLSEAVKYMLCIQEVEPLGLHKNIYIGEIGQVNLKAYRKHITDVVFAKPLPDLKAVVLDGHSKVRFGC